MRVRTLLPLVGATVAALVLSACASGGERFWARSTGVDYDGYYDEHYGPISDGYWGGDGAFYYQAGEGHAYHRDDEHHVWRQAGAGRHNIHGHHDDNPKMSDKPQVLNRAGRPPTDPMPKDRPHP